ncbi:shikimate dehydrogenase [Metabacillus sp. KIGAM252]|uniref:Shikimate dehydrogenase (NADP(+)) n=1 Tax=Metabacillus flavus TaxID=2823519 RepID=A0ABS5LGA5_9BACI|nr:shikimate dehydrogenase [Metabacillus flavus]MBS2969774.1 shikimate dehydrogenase [Metabacillus flavus]
MADLYGIIGCPVGHSMSPDIHNRSFKDQKLDAVYHRFHVEKDQLGAAVNGIRALGIKGVNVTIPHKENVIAYLDHVDKTAAEMGAVNTIVNLDGVLTGYNTDGPGYLESIKPFLTSPLSEMKCLIIGAGGAARGIYTALAHAQTGRIDVANRTKEKALAIIQEYDAAVPGRTLSLEEAECHLAEYHLVIQTTSIGMSPNINDQPISLENISEGTLVSDIIYNPIKTAFIKDAEQRGCRVIPGVGMFIYQAALSFRHWTGKMPDIQLMESVVLEKLGGK